MPDLESQNREGEIPEPRGLIPYKIQLPEEEKPKPDKKPCKKKEETPIEKLLNLSASRKNKVSFNPKAPIHVGKVCPVTLEEIEKKGEFDYFLTPEERRQHVGCIGTTGAGKTRLMMHLVTQDILNGNSVLIIDPKYDESLFARIIEAAALCGRLDEVIYFNPVLPEFSSKLNPLYIYYMPDELVEHVVAGVRAKEEYFENVAYEVTTAIVFGLYLLAISKGEKPNLTFYEIKKWCSHEKLGELYGNLEYLKFSKDPYIRELAQDIRLFIEQIRSSPADFFAKVSSSLRTVLTSLSASVVGDLVGKASYNEFLTRLESGKRAIIYCNTGVLIMRKASHVLGRIIISMIQSLIGRKLAKGESLNPPLVLYLDEGQNVLYRGVEEIFAKGRAANVWINFFTQSFASIRAVVGEELANTIIDNISTWFYMRINCEATANILERSLPKVTSFRKGLIPGGDASTVILREDEDSALKAFKFMGLPVRRFILKTANGEYYFGEVPHVPDPKVKIRFPNLYSISVIRSTPEEPVQ